jgi:thioredoxin-related protein
MKRVIVIALVAISVSGCSASSSPVASNGNGSNRLLSLTTDEKHRLYSAALAVSESPLDNDTFKAVCRQIGIFDAADKPNANYMAFVQEHVEWGMKPETEQFKREINTKEKAREYIKRYLS